jgi:outer membrane protein assembly factor BamB
MLVNKNRLKILLHVVVLIALLQVPAPQETGAAPLYQLSENDWPMLQHDVRHSGYTANAFVSPDYQGTLNVKWKVDLGERVEITMQPIVAYGHAYIGIMNGKLHAIDAETGSIAWTYQAGGAISHTPAAGEGKIFFGTEDHRIYALNAQTGQLIWVYETGGPVQSSPVVHDQTVYIGSFDHYLYALDTETGQLRWRYDAGDRVWTSPSLDVDNNRLFFGSEQPKAHCVNASNGQRLWDRDLTGEGMRNTYPTFSGNVVIFQTLKPGISSYWLAEDRPEYVDDATSLAQYADYYSRHPERRHLYYLDAATGADKWNGTGTHYVPVVIPYWGMLNPVVDPDGFAWIPVNSGGTTRNIDLYKIDLSDGSYIKIAEQEDFFERGDETGRFTFANGVYFSTVLSAIVKYNPQSNQRRRIFGPFPGGDPFECNNLDPMPVDCAHVDRMAGTTGFGGLHRASPLVIANGRGFFTSHGWLYALTPDDVSMTHSVDLGADFTSGPPATDTTYNDLVAELNDRVDQIIAHGHLEPFPYLWDWSGIPPSLWQEGELVRTLASTLPYLTQENQDALKLYLKQEVQNYLLDPGQYEYKKQCQFYGGYAVTDCESTGDEIGSQWYANNENHTAERVYAFYAYAKYTGDWQTIEANWNFIVSRYHTLADAFDQSLGHVVTKQWLSGRLLDLQTQAACFYAMREMATHRGDSNLAAEAEYLYNRTIQARVYYGTDLLPDLYNNGSLVPSTPEEEENQKKVYPPQGIVDQTTDIRQLGWRDAERIELRSLGVSPANQELSPDLYEAIISTYDYPAQYLQMYPEVGEALNADLQAATQRYINAIAFYNPWWYWGENGYAAHKAGENLYSKPFMAAALFQARAYILKEDFDTLKDYLPWPVNRAGFRDIYRLQNLVALLQATGANPPPAQTVHPSVADTGQTVTYAITLVGTGNPITVTVSLPDGLEFSTGSAQMEPDIGTLEVNHPHLTWIGVPPADTPFTLTFAAEVTTTDRTLLTSQATIEGATPTPLTLEGKVIANAAKVYLPLILKRWH